jgi:hypothetical protein
VSLCGSQHNLDEFSNLDYEKEKHFNNILHMIRTFLDLGVLILYDLVV